MTVTVFGGTGFVGRRIVAQLSSTGRTVRVAVRHPEKMYDEAAGEVTAIAGDILDDAAVARAIEGADGVVNAVGYYVERGGVTFDDVHVEGAARVARISANTGVSRLVHFSGIGADESSGSPYVRARAAGEAAVRDGFPAATILRPSAMFGLEDAFFNTLARIARTSPVLPLFGRGEMRLQPAFVDDVARAVGAVLYDPSSAGLIYELGGAKIYTYRRLIEMVLELIGRRRLLMPQPFALWEVEAAILRVLPSPPLTRHQIALMKQDNVTAPNLPGFAELGIEPSSVEEILPTYIGRDG